MTQSYPDLPLIIGGRRVAGGGRATTDVLNPANAQVLGPLPNASEADVDEALNAASRSFPAWRAVSAYERARILKKTAALMLERKEMLARVITLELGKPTADSRLEVDQAAGMFEWYAEEARRAYGRVIPARRNKLQLQALREPIGPIAAFAPWNAPAITPSRKLAGALAAGCTVVLKPAEETPATALAIADMLIEAGLPDGVMSLLFGNPVEISCRLLASSVIKGISFTGSTVVGKALARQCVEGMKRMTLELGGHAPVIVCGDVNAEKAGASAAAAKFRNSGQICTSPTRFYIHSSIYAEFCSAFAKAANAITVGDGFDPASKMGPLAHARRVDHIEGLVSDARKRGVKVAVGGDRCGDRGFFYRPTLLTDFNEECEAANIEPFGPLALASPFESLEEALTRANRVPFGLASYAMTHDIRNISTISALMESGNLIVNHWQVSLPETPFGGHKESGYGSEGGVEGLQAFQNVKFVSCLAE
jgi:succinate-semialdehyde dehydrogenase/glutarate-semialdehyde dehydrogenase